MHSGWLLTDSAYIFCAFTIAGTSIHVHVPCCCWMCKYKKCVRGLSDQDASATTWYLCRYRVGKTQKLGSKFGNLKSFIQSTEVRVMESLLDVVICASWLASFSPLVLVCQCQVCSTGADQCGYNTDCRFISTQSLNVQKFWNVSSCCLDRSMEVQHIIQKSLFSCPW